MHLIQKTSELLATHILNNLQEEGNTLTHSDLSRRLSLMMIYIGLVIILSLIGIVFEIFEELILSTIALMYIRMISGGNHFNSPDTCFFVTTFAIIVPLTHYIIPNQIIHSLYAPVLIAYLIISPHQNFKKKDYWITKLAMGLGVIITYNVSAVMFISFIILLIDQFINNSFKSEKCIERS